jgi:hypothetical protein
MTQVTETGEATELVWQPQGVCGNPSRSAMDCTFGVQLYVYGELLTMGKKSTASLCKQMRRQSYKSISDNCFFCRAKQRCGERLRVSTSVGSSHLSFCALPPCSTKIAAPWSICKRSDIVSSNACCCASLHFLRCNN